MGIGIDNGMDWVLMIYVGTENIGLGYGGRLSGLTGISTNDSSIFTYHVYICYIIMRDEFSRVLRIFIYCSLYIP